MEVSKLVFRVFCLILTSVVTARLGPLTAQLQRLSWWNGSGSGAKPVFSGSEPLWAALSGLTTAFVPRHPCSALQSFTTWSSLSSQTVLKSRYWICHIDPAHGSRGLHAHRRSPEGHLPERPHVRNEEHRGGHTFDQVFPSCRWPIHHFTRNRMVIWTADPSETVSWTTLRIRLVKAARW